MTTETETRLCVGGPAAGRRATAQGDVLRVMLPPPAAVTAYTPVRVTAYTPVRVAEYRLWRSDENELVWRFYKIIEG